jgi:heme-degrading monooxygenase HmoA/Ni,Fe-hydrogenase III component G
MILAISRFRVANGMEGEVKEAFFNRPHLVDSVPAFLGMETFTDTSDPTIFYLITRWTDAESFRSWHKSAEHRLSHKFIPKGLKLDPKYTKVTILDRLAQPGRMPEFEEAVADSLPVIAKYLNQASNLHFIAVSPGGIILACNKVLAEHLQKKVEELIGRNISEFLTDESATFLHGIAENPESSQHKEHLLLNFVDAHLHPFTLECSLAIRPDGFVIIGAPPVEKEKALQEELIALNNQFSVLIRENERQSKALKKAHKELEKAHEDLRQSHWHLKKIQEVLPICSVCHKVKTGDGQWDSLLKYFNDNSDFLSHGYCDECAARAMKQVEDYTRRKAELEAIK